MAGLEPSVPSLASRIAAVLEQHRPYGLDCKCGVPINSDGWWAAHVEPLILALFETEWRIRWDNSTTVMPAADAESAWELVRLYQGRTGHVESRAVGPWELHQQEDQ